MFSNLFILKKKNPTANLKKWCSCVWFLSRNNSPVQFLGTTSDICNLSVWCHGMKIIKCIVLPIEQKKPTYFTEIEINFDEPIRDWGQGTYCKWAWLEQKLFSLSIHFLQQNKEGVVVQKQSLASIDIFNPSNTLLCFTLAHTYVSCQVVYGRSLVSNDWYIV